MSTLLIALTASAASAQTVYRCGSDGRTYSQQPCADGKPVDAADPRSAAQRADAQRASAREKALAANLERDRRADEAAQRPATQAGSFKAPSATPAMPSAAPTVRHYRRLRRHAR